MVAAKRHRHCCFRPWRCSEVKMYSCKRWIQRAVGPCTLLKLMSHVNAEWSVCRWNSLSVEVLMEMFQYPHDCRYSSGGAVISLRLVQCLTVVGFYSLLSVLYLGEHTSNPNVTRVCQRRTYLLRLALSKGPNRVGISPHLSTKTDPVSETSCFFF
jgi:hypothetical protein